MPERYRGEPPEGPEHEDREEEFFDLLRKAQGNIESLSPTGRDQLVEFGDHALDVEGDVYAAERAYTSAQDYAGMRRVLEYFLQKNPDENISIPKLLNNLEDHEGIRDWLDREDVTHSSDTVDHAFSLLHEALYDYLKHWGEENGTPKATGGVNEGADLVALRNLSTQYDVAVPIARGGLNQGAIAHLWGMPTRTVDIAAHGRKVARGKWVNPVAREDFDGKRVLLLDKDAVSGASIRKAIKMLEKFHPGHLGAYFLHKIVEPMSMEQTVGTVTSGLPRGLKLHAPERAPGTRWRCVH